MYLSWLTLWFPSLNTSWFCRRFVKFRSSNNVLSVVCALILPSTSTSLSFSVESLLWQKPTNFNLDDSVWDSVCMRVPFPVVLLPLSADAFCLWSEQWRLQMFHRDRTFNLGVCVCVCERLRIEKDRRTVAAAAAAVWRTTSLLLSHQFEEMSI